MPPLKTESKPQQVIEQIPSQQLELKLKGILDEYLKDCCTVAKCDKDIRKCIPTSPHSRQLSLGYDLIVEESTRARIRTATLLAQFIRMNMLPLESYCVGLEEILERVDDLTIENSSIWEYLAEMVALLLYENILPLEKLHASCEVLISQGNAGKFLGPILKLIVTNKGPEYLASLWHGSELIFEDFLPTDDVDKFIKDNQLEFLVDGLSTSDSESALTFEQIHEKLLDFFENENSFDDISNWITVNVGDRVRDKQFIRVLASAVFENSIVGLNFNDEILRRHYKILLQYIDGNLEYEVQLLYALQAHINKLEDPQGLLLKVFMILFEDSMLSQDSIVHWESNKDPEDEEDEEEEEVEQEDVEQLSPSNTTSRKVYDKDFLLALRSDPKSNKKPDNLLDEVLCEDPEQIGDIITNDVLSPNKSTYLGYKPYSSQESSQRASVPLLRDTSSRFQHDNWLVVDKKPKLQQEVTQRTLEQTQLKMKKIFEDYINTYSTMLKVIGDIRENIPNSELCQLVSEGYFMFYILDRSKTARIRTGSLFAQLIRMRTIPLESYCAGLEEVFKQLDDLIFDIPKIWEYLAELVAPLLYENTLPLKRLHASCSILISRGHAAKLLGPVLKLVVAEKGSYNLIGLWKISQQCKDFMPAADVDKFIKDNQLEFLVGGVTSSTSSLRPKAVAIESSSSSDDD